MMRDGSLSFFLAGFFTGSGIILGFFGGDAGGPGICWFLAIVNLAVGIYLRWEGTRER